jgi:hypothetical protein
MIVRIIYSTHCDRSSPYPSQGTLSNKTPFFCLPFFPSLLHADFQDDPVERDTEAIKQEAELWVQRCKYSAAVVMSLWIGWIVAAQLLRDILPPSWYMLNADDSAQTGW